MVYIVTNLYESWKIIRKGSKLQIIITQPFLWILMPFKKEIMLQICSYHLDKFDAPYSSEWNKNMWSFKKYHWTQEMCISTDKIILVPWTLWYLLLDFRSSIPFPSDVTSDMLYNNTQKISYIWKCYLIWSWYTCLGWYRDISCLCFS